MQEKMARRLGGILRVGTRHLAYPFDRDKTKEAFS